MGHTLGEMGGDHRPRGFGSIWEKGLPGSVHIEDAVTLTPPAPWSTDARAFLAQVGPLDARGWKDLARGPVQGWPAAEIIEAMCASGLQDYVPVEVVGMLTDRDPGGLYLG